MGSDLAKFKNILDLGPDSATDGAGSAAFDPFLDAAAFAPNFANPASSPFSAAPAGDAPSYSHDAAPAAPAILASAARTPAPTLVTSNPKIGGNLSFKLVWDSSVATAGADEAPFMRSVIEAARFYANNLTTPTPVTLTIDVGYGEVAGSPLQLGAVSESSDNGDFISYNKLYAAMKQAPKSIDPFIANYFAHELPTPAQFTALTGKSAAADNVFVTYAEEQALGMTPAYTYGEPDGWIGIAANDPGGFLGTGLFATPMDYTSDPTLRSTGANATGGYDAVGAAAHEISEVMGRIAGLGATLVTGKGATWTPLDFARYTASGALDLTSAQGYFSLNGGVTALGDYDNAGGDPGDWAQSNPVQDSYGYFNLGSDEPVSATGILENAVLGYGLTAVGYANAGKTAGPTFV